MEGEKRKMLLKLVTGLKGRENCTINNTTCTWYC